MLLSTWRQLAGPAGPACFRRGFHATHPAFKIKNKLKKAAKLRKVKARQETLRQERAEQQVDVIIGRPSEFTRSILKPVQVIFGRGRDGMHERNESFFFQGQEIPQYLDAAEKAQIQRRLDSYQEALDKMKAEREASSGPFGGMGASGPGDAAPALDLESVRAAEKHKSEVIRRLTDLRNANAKAVQLYNVQQAVKRFARAPGDTGSSEVQAAVLTVRIHALYDHVKRNKKDHANYRALRHLVNQRARVLRYLRRDKPERYFEVIPQLGLADDAVTRQIRV